MYEQLNSLYNLYTSKKTCFDRNCLNIQNTL